MVTSMVKNCIVCNKRIKRLWRKSQKFCGAKCQTKYRVGKHLTTQWRENIGKSLKGHTLPKIVRDKIRKTLKGKFVGNKNFNWKGGEIVDKYGYVLVRQPNHPYRNGINYVRRSRLVIEKKIGRYLTPEEVVHHINSIKNDDRPENLQLFSDNGKHRKFHSKLI